ncbi:MAG: hypothetical protein R6U35_07380 [Candidatus Humimicrobiaceae bacterium]
MDINLIIGALGQEVSGALSLLKIKSKTRQGNAVIYRCSYESKIFWVLKTGMGRKNTAEAFKFLLNMMDSNSIVVAFNTGFCGATSKNFEIGDILSYSKIKSLDTTYGNIVEKDEINLRKIENNIPVEVTGGTTEYLTNDKALKEKILKHTGVQAVDMESYYIAKLMAKKNINFQVLRVVSDTLENNFPGFFMDFSLGNNISGIINLFKFILNPRNIKKMHRVIKNIKIAKKSLNKTVKLLVLH